MRWVHQVSGEGADAVYAVAMDATGDVFVAGAVDGPATGLGTGFPAGSGHSDIFVARLAAADGQPVWARRLGGSQPDVAFGIAVDSAGDPLVTGYFGQQLDLDGTSLASAGHQDIFVVKLAGATGTTIWGRSYGGGDIDVGRAIVASATGDVFVTGSFVGSIDLGGVPLTSAGAAPDVFVARVASDGAVAWARRFGGQDADEGNGIAFDSTGGLALTGFFSGSVAFDGVGVTSAGRRDAFVAKLSPGGAITWANRYGGAEDDEGRAIAVGAAGDVFVSGCFQGRADFGAGPVASAGLRDIFVMSLASGGGVTWSRTIGAASDDIGLGLALTSAGDLVVSGELDRAITIDGTTLTTAGGPDILVLQLSSANAVTSVQSHGGQRSDFGYAVATGAADRVAVAGRFAGSSSFAGTTLSGRGLWDGFALVVTSP